MYDPEVSTEESEQVGTWNEKGSYHQVYGGLENYSPKKLLDQELVDQIIGNTTEKEEVLVAELGAGPAPISTLLTKKGQQFQCEAFDLNPEMTLGKSFPFSYTTGFDLTEMHLDDKLIGRYDAVVLEHSLYTVTMSPDGTRNFSKQEADFMRQLAFNKAAAMLKPGGILVMSDPITSTENFGAERIVTFLKREQQADRKLGLGNTPSLLEVLTRRLKDSEMKKVLSENKNLMRRVRLASVSEMQEMVKNSRLFEEKPIRELNDDYLGSNYTVVLRRNGNPITTNPEAGNQLDSSFMIEGIPHPRILNIVGDFRRKVYAQSGTTEQLPRQDKFDKKDGLLLVYLSRNKPGIAAVATLQPSTDIGLDVEELMSENGGGRDPKFRELLINRLAQLSPAVALARSQGREIQLSEVRRLAADNLDRGSLQEFFGDMAKKFVDYARRKNIDVALFLTEPKRAKLFNWANGVTEFKPLEDFRLNRQKEHQSMMLCAANYFFGDWKTVLGEEQSALVEEAIKMVGNSNDWRDAIRGHEKESQYTLAIEKLFSEAKDNVNIYYTDYPIMHRTDN